LGARESRLHFGPPSLCQRLVLDLPKGHDLGCVSVILCSDAGDSRYDLLRWLSKKARKKGFSLVSVIGPATTAEALHVHPFSSASCRRSCPCIVFAGFFVAAIKHSNGVSLLGPVLLERTRCMLKMRGVAQ
jgi:hypothetical protein